MCVGMWPADFDAVYISSLSMFVKGLGCMQ
jgi:hypothetical protein